MATGATEFVDKTISDGIFSPDIWSKQVLRATESNLLFAKSVNRGFENDASVGKTVKVASIGNLAARAKTENTAIVYETVAETATTITLNIWSYAALGIEDIVKVQSIVDVQNEYQQKLGYALAKDIDSALAIDVAGFTPDRRHARHRAVRRQRAGCGPAPGQRRRAADRALLPDVAG